MLKVSVSSSFGRIEWLCVKDRVDANGIFRIEEVGVIKFSD